MDRTFSSTSLQLCLIGFGSCAIDIIGQLKRGPEYCDTLVTIAIADDQRLLDRSIADLKLSLDTLKRSDCSLILADHQVTVCLISNRDPLLAKRAAEVAEISKSIDSITIAVNIEDKSIDTKLPNELFSHFHARVNLSCQPSADKDFLNKNCELYQQIEGGIVHVLKAIIANEYSSFTINTFYDQVNNANCDELICGSIRALKAQERYTEHPSIIRARERWASLPISVLWIEVEADEQHEVGLLNNIHHLIDLITRGLSDELNTIFGVQHKLRVNPESIDLHYLAIVSKCERQNR